MGADATKQPQTRRRLFVAEAYDPRARVGVVVVELRGGASQFHEAVLRGVSGAAVTPAAAALVVQVVLDAGLTAVDLHAPNVHSLLSVVGASALDIRVRRVARRRNRPARDRAHRRLRELVPLPKRGDTRSLADQGVELEMARLGDADEGCEGDLPW